jgi:hypothetical protein
MDECPPNTLEILASLSQQSWPQRRLEMSWTLRETWEEETDEPTFIHIPKNGGTAISSASRNVHGGIPTEFNKQAMCSPYHLPPQWMDNFGPYSRLRGTNKTNTFVVLRDPFARILSQYKWSCWAHAGFFVLDGMAGISSNTRTDSKADKTRVWGHVEALGFCTQRYCPLEIKQKLPPKEKTTDSARVKECFRNTTEMNKFLEYAIPTFSKPTVAQELGLCAGNSSGLTAAAGAGRVDVEDCHYVPQHIFAASAKHVFCSVKAAVAMLRSHGRTGAQIDKLHDFHPRSAEVLNSFSDKVVRLIELHYAEDIELFTKCTEAIPADEKASSEERKKTTEAAGKPQK